MSGEQAEGFGVHFEIPALDHAREYPDVTIHFETGAGKLLLGKGTRGDKPMFTLTAKEHDEPLGTGALRKGQLTAVVSFAGKENIDQFIEHLEEIRDEHWPSKRQQKKTARKERQKASRGRKEGS